MTNQFTMATKLLDHLSHCRQCKAAKVKNSRSYCAVGQKLIEKTIKERHG